MSEQQRATAIAALALTATLGLIGATVRALAWAGALAAALVGVAAGAMEALALADLWLALPRSGRRVGSRSLGAGN